MTYTPKTKDDGGSAADPKTKDDGGATDAQVKKDVRDAKSDAKKDAPKVSPSTDKVVKNPRNTITPVHVDGRSRTSDEDPLEGHNVEVVKGEFKGLFGVFEDVNTVDKDNWPETILVRDSGAPDHLVLVKYKECVASNRDRRIAASA